MIKDLILVISIALVIFGIFGTDCENMYKINCIAFIKDKFLFYCY